MNNNRVLVISPGGCASKSVIDFLKPHVGEINCPNNSDNLKHALPWSPQVKKYNPTHIIYLYGDLDKAVRSIFRRNYFHSLYYKLHGIIINSLPIPFHSFEQYITILVASQTDPLGIINHINSWKQNTVLFIHYENINNSIVLADFLNINIKLLNKFAITKRISKYQSIETLDYYNTLIKLYDLLSIKNMKLEKTQKQLQITSNTKLSIPIVMNNNYIYKEKNILFCTFGSDGYEDTLSRIKLQAKNSNYFSNIFIYNHTNTPGIIDHLEFIRNNKRGFGYWIWKPLVILDVMKKSKPSDIIVFADAGCTISNENGREIIFNKYITDVLSDNSHRLGFHINHREATWTKNDLFDHLNLKAKKYTETNQILGGIQILVNTKENQKLMHEWFEIMTIDNYHYVNDSDSITDNDILFKEHRHDQSVLSLLKKKYGYCSEILEGVYPIEDTRNRMIHK